MRAAISVEWLKLRRSPIAWTTAVLVGLVVPAMTAGFMAAARLGPSDKPVAIKINAMLIGEGWTAYLGMLTQILSVAMVMGAGFVISWAFGREFTDHTVASLFALPTSRATIAAAKFVVLAIWAAGVCAIVLVAAFALAPVAGLPLPGLDDNGAALKVLAVGVTGALLATPMALVASVARGALPAIATLILIVVATQIVTLVGFGSWFPYAVPSLWAGMGGQAAADLIEPVHLALVPVTSALAAAATIWRWQKMQIA